MRYLRQSTSVDLPIGPFLDNVDGFTAESALTLTQPDIRLKKNAAAWAQKAAAQTLSHEENGWYEVTLDATDTDTCGQLMLSVQETGALPVWCEFHILEEAVYDALFAASAPGYLQPTVAARTLDVSAGGEAGIDWANIGSPTTAQNLSATNIDVDQVVASVSGAVGSVTGAVGSVASGGITAASIAADAITAAKIADGAIDAATFAAGAINAAAIASDAITDAKVASDVTIASVTGAVGSVTGAVGSVTGAVGSVTGAVGSVASGGITAASFAANAINAAKLDPDVTTELQAGLATAAALATVDGIVDDILLDTAEIGTAGAGLTNIDLPNQTMNITGNITGNLSGSVGSVTGAVGSVTAGVTLAASAVQAIWDALTSALTTVGSIGKLLGDNVNATISSRSSHSAADVWAAATRILTAGTNIVLAKGTGVTGFNDLSAAQVNTEADTALSDYDPPTRAELTSDTNSILSKLLKYVQLTLRKDAAIATDNATEVTAINADGGSGAGAFANTTDAQEAIRDRGDAAWTTATGFSTHSAADVWAVATRTLTAFDASFKTGYALSSAGVQTIWDALTSALTTAGSVGKRIADFLTGDAFVRLGAPAGASVSADIAAIEAQTDDIGVAGAGLTALGDTRLANLDATISSRLASASYTTPPTVGAIADQVWDETLADHLGAGSTGNALNAAGAAGDPWTTALPGAYGAGSAGKIVGDNVNATISSRSSHSAADVWAVGVRTLTAFDASFKTGYALSAAGVQAVWDVLTSALTTVGSVGKLLVDNVNATISSRSSHSAADVWAAGTRTLTSFGTLASDVWAVATRLLTAGTNIVLAKGTGVTGFNDPTAGAIADQVWDEAIADHAGAGSTGEALADAGGAGTPPTVTEIRQELDANSTKLASIDGKTTNLPSDPADQSLIIAATNAIMLRLGVPVGADLSADIAAIPAAVWAVGTRTLTSFGTLAADVWAAVTRTLTAATNITSTGGTTVPQTGDSFARLGAAGVGLTAVPWNVSWDVEVQSEATDALNAYDPPTKAELDAAVAPLATAVNLATLDTVADSILAMLDDARGEPGQGAPPVNPDMATKVDYLYKLLRNKLTQDATTLKVYDDAGTTVDHKATVSDDGTLYTRGELGTGL